MAESCRRQRVAGDVRRIAVWTLAAALAGCSPKPADAPLLASAGAAAKPEAPGGVRSAGADGQPAPAAAPERQLPRASTQALRHADFAAFRPSLEAREIADWVVGSGDNGGRPFIVIDKVRARVIAFGADGRLRGAAPALLGLARGDDSVPGIGERPIAQIRPEERTTPAGRFEAEMGRNAHGEDILWVDYDNAISMHRVRATNPAERRLERLASPTVDDNRISYGCINLPVAFYEGIVKPLFEPHNGVVYVLPETRSARQVFPGYARLLAVRR